ncbi:hypothetical protein Tco_1291960 [Tanacetum coccineum]
MSEFKQTNQFAKAVSSIPAIVDNYLASKLKDAVDIDSNMKAIIKEQVKAQVSKIKPKTSYAVAASLSEFELKKILIDKIEENKSINKSDIQKNLYNALVESYNSDKDIISSYGDVVTLKRGRDDQDKDEDPSARSNQGSKRRRSGKEAESSKEPTHKEFKSTSSSKGASRSQPKSSSKSAQAEEHSQKVDVFPTYDLIKGTCKSVVELEYHLEEVFKATNDQLNWHNPEGRQYPHDLSKPLPLIPNDRGRQGTYHWGPKRHKFYGYAANMETSKDVYSRHKIIAVTSLKIVQFFGYSHLEEIIVRRQSDQLYKFREGDFKGLRRQDTKDMLLLLVQGKLTNLNLDERFALNAALRMYTRRIVIEERVEDL